MLLVHRSHRKPIAISSVVVGVAVILPVSCSTPENETRTIEQPRANEVLTPDAAGSSTGPHQSLSLVGKWAFVEHGETGLDALFRPPVFVHPREIEFRQDGTFVATFGHRAEACVRELDWPEPLPEELHGKFEVRDTLGMRDLYVPRKWLAMDPGPPPRRFTVEGDKLTVHRVGDGWAQEIYKKQ